MDRPEIKHGDKLFLYGQFMTLVEHFDEYEYNSVMGMVTKGGYQVYIEEADDPGASVPGFIVEVSLDPSLAPQTPFNQMEMVDITDRLSKTPPLPSGTKIWMPTRQLP